MRACQFEQTPPTMRTRQPLEFSDSNSKWGPHSDYCLLTSRRVPELQAYLWSKVSLLVEVPWLVRDVHFFKASANFSLDLYKGGSQ